MVWEKVAEMSQMRHENLGNEFRLVSSATSGPSAPESG